MRREIACKLDGQDVVQTTSLFNAEGKLERETVIVLGDRATVLEHLDEQLAEARRDLDGMSAPDPAKPTPSPTGPAGRTEVKFWREGNSMYRMEVRYNGQGKLQMSRAERLGPAASRLANAVERHAEIQDLRNKVAGAQ